MSTQAEGVPVSVRKKRGLLGPVVFGVIAGIAIGMLAVSAGSEMTDKTYPNSIFAVWVFGARIHQETVTHSAEEVAAGVSEWRGTVWGLGLTAAFAAVGGLVGACLGTSRRQIR